MTNRLRKVATPLGGDSQCLLVTDTLVSGAAELLNIDDYEILAQAEGMTFPLHLSSRYSHLPMIRSSSQMCHAFLLRD